MNYSTPQSRNHLPVRGGVLIRRRGRLYPSAPLVVSERDRTGYGPSPDQARLDYRPDWRGIGRCVVAITTETEKGLKGLALVTQVFLNDV